MSSKVTITNENAEALEVTKYRSNNNVIVPGKVGETPGSVDIDTSPVQWFTESEQRAHYVNTYGSLPGITVVADVDSDPVGSIGITVLDHAGVAISGASITYSGLETPITTNAQGVANFTGLEAGTYALAISKTGYTTKNVSVVLGIDGVAKVNVALVPSAGGSIAFKVIDNTGAAVSGASIACTGLTTATTDAQGVAEFTGLAAGTRSFTISKATFSDTVVEVVLDTNISEAYIQAVLLASGG